MANMAEMTIFLSIIPLHSSVPNEYICLLAYHPWQGDRGQPKFRAEVTSCLPMFCLAIMLQAPAEGDPQTGLSGFTRGATRVSPVVMMVLH